MNDFWISCGHHLLDRDEGGGLLVTDEFLKVYLARPELIPPPEACAVERTLHAALLADPRSPVAAADIAAIADADARENWQMLIAFRDHLLRHKTLEAAYVDLVRNGIGKTPPLFVNQLVHVILRNALDGVTDARVLRAAELFFRTQRVTLHEGSLIAADEETIGGINTAPVSPLVSMLGIPAEAEIDIINDDNAESYWERSDQFDMALDLTGGRAGLAALAEAMRRWIAHVLGVEVTIEPLTELREAPLSWYVGLDADATKIGDLLWNGEDLDEATMARVVGLFALDVPRSVDHAGQGQRRAGLSDPGDDAGQDDPHEAAEPGHRPADPASGGGQMSVATPLANHRGRRRGRAQQRRHAMDRFRLASGRACWPARRKRRPGRKLTDDGERATFYAGAAEIELYRTETTYYRNNLESGAPALWVALRATEAEPPYTVAAVTADPAEGESLTETATDHGRAGADAGGDPATRCGLRRRAPCRAAVRQAQARPRRSGSARAAHADARR